MGKFDNSKSFRTRKTFNFNLEKDQESKPKDNEYKEYLSHYVDWPNPLTTPRDEYDKFVKDFFGRK